MPDTRQPLVNSSAMRRPSCLHGVHCPHDSTARNRDDARGDGDEVGRVVEHDEAAPSRARCRSRHAPRSSAACRAGRAGMSRVGDAGQHGARSSRPGRAPPPSVSITSRSGVPIVELADAVRAASRPLTVHTIVPGDSSVPTLAEPVGALGRRCRARWRASRRCRRASGGASVVVAGAGHLDVRRQPAARVDVAGRLDDLVDAAAVRRRDARERVAAVDHLEQRGLLAVEVLGRPLEHFDSRRRRVQPALSISSIAARTRSVSIVNDSLHRDDDHGAAPTAERGDERTLEHAVRDRPQDRAVLERARLTLGGVHDDRRRLRRRTGWRRPCATCAGRKARTAATPQARRVQWPC